METFEIIFEIRKKTEIIGRSFPIFIENVMPGDTITLDIEEIKKQFNLT